MSKKLKITLVKSLIGRNKNHIIMAKQLGLSKIGKSSEHHDIPSVRGMIDHIKYLIDVEEIA